MALIAIVIIVAFLIWVKRPNAEERAVKLGQKASAYMDRAQTVVDHSKVTVLQTKEDAKKVTGSLRQAYKEAREASKANKDQKAS